MTGGGEVLASALPENFFGEGDANLKASILIFTILLGAFVVIGTKGVDGIKKLLHNISAERIRIEFNKLLCGEGATQVMRTYRDIVAEVAL